MSYLFANLFVISYNFYLMNFLFHNQYYVYHEFKLLHEFDEFFNDILMF